MYLNPFFSINPDAVDGYEYSRREVERAFESESEDEPD